MPQFESQTVAVLFYILCVVVAALLFWLGYRWGRWIGRSSASRLIEAKEQELFTAQRGFKNVYEQELAELRRKNDELEQRVRQLLGKVETYRKKAAGLGGLFSSGGKRADAMYALLLENEALEEALYSQNDKLRQERTDALKEQLRATGYRRVLISQLLADDRVKGVVSSVLADEKHLPDLNSPPQQSLPQSAPPGEHR